MQKNKEQVFKFKENTATELVNKKPPISERLSSVYSQIYITILNKPSVSYQQHIDLLHHLIRYRNAIAAINSLTIGVNHNQRRHPPDAVPGRSLTPYLAQQI